MKYYLINEEGKERVIDTCKEQVDMCIIDGHRFGFDTDTIAEIGGIKYGIVKTEKEYIGNVTLQQLVDACKEKGNYNCDSCKFYDFCRKLEDNYDEEVIPGYWNLYI